MSTISVFGIITEDTQYGRVLNLRITIWTYKFTTRKPDCKTESTHKKDSTETDSNEVSDGNQLLVDSMDQILLEQTLPSLWTPERRTPKE